MTDVLVSLLTLTSLEIVLGIDNIIFISILAARLPAHERERARKLGIAGAFVTRMLLLLGISWIAQLTEPLLTVAGTEFSGKSLILMVGGVFLLFKATRELHHKLEGDRDASLEGPAKAAATIGSVIFQILLLDVVFSLDSVITAVGMAQALWIMVTANVVALGVMLVAGRPVHEFVEEHPTFKILALSFLLLVGFVLVTEGLGVHIPKGYIYFAMGFSVFVEFLNLKLSKKHQPVKLKSSGP